MTRGLKSCPKCSKKVAARTRTCIHCGYHIDVKGNNFDWRYLEEGDEIKISGGPYYVTKNNELIPTGYSGKFKVVRIQEQGIVVAANTGSGYAYLYMGPKRKSNLQINAWEVPYRIEK